MLSTTNIYWCQLKLSIAFCRKEMTAIEHMSSRKKKKNSMAKKLIKQPVVADQKSLQGFLLVSLCGRAQGLTIYTYIYGVHKIYTVFRLYVYNSEVCKFPFINFVIDIGSTPTVLFLITRTSNSVKKPQHFYVQVLSNAYTVLSQYTFSDVCVCVCGSTQNQLNVNYFQSKLKQFFIFHLVTKMIFLHISMYNLIQTAFLKMYSKFSMLYILNGAYQLYDCYKYS